MSELLGGLQDRTFARATTATAVCYRPERRLSATQLVSYLDRRAFAVVGSTRADGRPHAAMSVFIRRGTTFWLPTMAGSVRERNLRGTPWLTMVIAEGDHPEHIAVIIEGRGRGRRGPGPCLLICHLHGNLPALEVWSGQVYLGGVATTLRERWRNLGDVQQRLSQ